MIKTLAVFDFKHRFEFYKCRLNYSKVGLNLPSRCDVFVNYCLHFKFENKNLKLNTFNMHSP